MKTTNGKEIRVRRTGEVSITPNAYTVYAGTIKIAGGCTASEARKIVEDLTHPTAEHIIEMMDLTW